MAGPDGEKVMAEKRLDKEEYLRLYGEAIQSFERLCTFLYNQRMSYGYRITFVACSSQDTVEQKMERYRSS